MTRLHPAGLALTALTVLVGCVREEAPPPQSELVPTPPVDAGPVVWQPGHWLLSGSNWVWQAGQYVPPPPGETTWVPGRWAQQSTGAWTWLEGHWA